MKLLQNEAKLISSNADKIILTDYRIMMTDKVLGRSYKISIFLEDISSIETHYKSNILFLITGVIVIIAGLLLQQQGGDKGLIGFLLLGGILIVIWWFSRKHIVTISSDGGSQLKFVVEKMSDEKIENFITSLQEAKLKRVNQLSKA